MMVFIYYIMDTIKQLNTEFIKMQAVNFKYEEEKDKDPNVSLAEELYYWEKQLLIFKNNREVKRHCLRQKIKQVNRLNKLSKEFKMQVSDLRNKK